MVLIKQDSEKLQALETKFPAEAKEEARQQFAAIIADKSLTLTEIDDKLRKWAAEQGEQIQSEFEDAKKKQRSMFDEVEYAIATSSSLSDAKS
uniref:ANIS5_cation-bd domain-containing protein n=1 Tax=Ascaris lumbricoides TaxID=6252 RepID=A0A0M3I8F8_ASCLU